MQDFSNSPYENNTIVSNEDASIVVGNFMAKVYGWMTAGLAITSITAFYIFDSGLIVDIFPYRMFLLIATLGIVWFLSARIDNIKSTTAISLFLLYSFITGITFSAILVAYSGNAIVYAFATTTISFAGLSLYGMITKKDLTGVGQFMIMGLLGIIVASILNIFLQIQALYTAISILGVFIFAGLTAYDTQKLREMALYSHGDRELATKSTIMGALTLYLDFINLFLFILRLIGGRRD